MKPHPTVAIVIPVYKHSGLVTEAIRSALNQIAEFRHIVVLVNDGCPFMETDTVCLQYAASYPDQIYYIKKPNGGLSSARNAGIDFALDAFATLKAVYLMDADNRITPYLLKNLFEKLDASPPEVGWAYPDIDKFGIEEFCDVSGEYKPLEHLIMNICEAGSMVRRSVFDAGVRFDEKMIKGYEDWEFWLQCIDAGFRGVHVQASGFCYRQRGESMVRDSERHHAEIISYIKDKHKRLFSRRETQQLETQALSRYSFFLNGTKKIIQTTDLRGVGTRISYEDYASKLLRCQEKPELGAVPGYNVCCSSQHLDILTGLGLAHGLLWRLQQLLNTANIAALHLDFSHSSVTEVEIVSDEEVPHTTPVLAICRTDLLQEAMRDDSTAWIGSIVEQEPLPRIAHLRVRISAPFDHPNPVNAFEMLLALIHQLRGDYRSVQFTGRPITFIQEQRRLLSRPDVLCERLYGTSHVFPVMPKNAGEFHIGFLLPVAEFGGVEKVAFNYANALKEAGYATHLFLVGGTRVVIPEKFEDAFSTTTFFSDPALNDYNRCTDYGSNYFGVGVPQWGNKGNVNLAIGMLLPMDVVINFHVPAFNAVMAPLRKLGTKTFTSQHLVDQSWIKQPIGSPHQFLAFEHAYDGVLAISQQLLSEFKALGVPEQKLLHIPNSASYPVAPSLVRSIMRKRALREPDHKLRALFIGRFDPQKGLDRLITLIQICAASGLELDWRVVGKRILGKTEFYTQALERYLHPAAITSSQLNEHYEWADVLILPSRFEGVPLTIFEAGRLGCVPLATDVGAVREIIEHGTTGYLLGGGRTDEELVLDLRQCLGALGSDRNLLKQLSRNATEYYGARTWQSALQPLLRILPPPHSDASHTAKIA